MPGWMQATINHPPPRDERPYHVRSREELESEAEWVRAAYLDEPAPNAQFPPLCSHETDCRHSLPAEECELCECSDDTWQPGPLTDDEDEDDERVAAEALAEWAADGYRTVPFEQVCGTGDGPLPPIPAECYPPDAVPLEPIELVPGGGVSTLPGAPGTHQDADGAVTTAPRGPGGAAPSAQTPAAPAYGRTDPAPRTARRGAAAEPLSWVGRGGGLDLILWAAVATALVITTVFALVQVARMPNVISWRWSP